MKKRRGKFWLNDKSEFYWEIVKGGFVHDVIEKTHDDERWSEHGFI
jgi:hypothetical protein